MLEYKKGQLTQPIGVRRVNWRHPLLRNVLAFVDPWTGTERVTGTQVAPAYSGAKMGVGPGGYGFYTGSGSKWTFTPRTPADIVNNRKVSIFALTSILSTPTQAVGGIVGTQSPNQMGLVTSSVATDLRSYWISFVSTGYTLTGGKVVAAYMRQDRLSANTLQGTATDTRSPSLLSSTGGTAGVLAFPATWEIGGDSRVAYETSRFIEQVLHLAVIVNDYWTQEQFDSLVADPWQLYEPRRIWVPQAAASGLPTLGTVGATAITSSGFRPSVTYTY